MRSAISLIMLSLYVCAVNSYIYGFYFTTIEKFYLKLFYYWCISIFTLWLIIDELLGYKSPYHWQFNIISKIALLVNIFLITFTYQLRIINPVYGFFVFNGTMLVISLVILIFGLKHSIFKNEK